MRVHSFRTERSHLFHLLPHSPKSNCAYHLRSSVHYIPPQRYSYVRVGHDCRCLLWIFGCLHSPSILCPDSHSRTADHLTLAGGFLSPIVLPVDPLKTAVSNSPFASSQYRLAAEGFCLD